MPDDTTVYLLHFSRPVGNLSNPHGAAQHYIGCTNNLKRRMGEHRCGHGAKVTALAVTSGADLVVARTWPGASFEDERQLKARHNAAALCPLCHESYLVRQHAYRERKRNGG